MIAMEPKASFANIPATELPIILGASLIKAIVYFLRPIQTSRTTSFQKHTEIFSTSSLVTAIQRIKSTPQDLSIGTDSHPLLAVIFILPIFKVKIHISELRLINLTVSKQACTRGHSIPVMYIMNATNGQFATATDTGRASFALMLICTLRQP
mmetsp:Transcript_12708/g.26908  ORF Transcript_12708/g.26908 Transcript_12708/m.26908 type:complete len:153 (-) Transcript_12708:1383-1841(-)